MKLYEFRETAFKEELSREFALVASSQEGFFETLLWEKGQLFELEQHLERLNLALSTFSTHFLDRSLAVSLQSLLSIAFKNCCCRVKLMVFFTADTFVCAVAIKPYLRPVDGVSLLTSPFRPSPHRPNSGFKSTSYSDYSIAFREAQAAGASEALLINTDGHVCEGATTNIFALINGSWYTPSLDTGCLPGVMRTVVIGRGLAAGLNMKQELLTPEQFLDADAVLVTNSLRRVQVVTSLDGVPFRAPASNFLNPLLDLKKL